MRHRGFPLAIAGSHANNTPRQTPLRPKRRPPRLQHPIVGVIHRGGLHRGHDTSLRGGLTATKRGELHHEGRDTPKQNSPNENRTGPFRYKTRPARVAQSHLRYKTHPIRTTPRQFRYKTHPARPKWLISARFARVWRTLYRCRQQETTQGELSTACEAETGLTNTTAHQAPLLWRAPEGPGGLSITGPGCGTRGRRGLAAVPVGGGRARAGLEIDHSEPSGSRVAISRAGRRPPAHTAARPHKAAQDPCAA